MKTGQPYNVSFAVIGGSGAYHLLSENTLGEELDCTVLDTPFGQSSPIHRFRNKESEFIFLSRHGEKDYSLTAPFVNYKANIYALKACGAERIVSWSGPGIINQSFQPGDFVLPHDVIDETRNRPTTFFEGRGVGFIRQSEVFCPQIRQVLHEVLHDAEIPHPDKAVYACTEGPRLETPAEIKKLRIIGADLVGMTLVPEAFLARELEICYTPICYLTNYAEGVVERNFKGGELFEGMQSQDERASVETSVRRFPEIIKGYLEKIIGPDVTGAQRDCNCQQALRRYKDKGMISEDWKQWFTDEDQ
jgi:5'-methylthioadenosine phosphorylase